MHTAERAQVQGPPKPQTNASAQKTRHLPQKTNAPAEVTNVPAQKTNAAPQKTGALARQTFDPAQQTAAPPRVMNARRDSLRSGGKVHEPREVAVKADRHGARRPVSVLGYNQVGFACPGVLSLVRALPMKQDHHVRILLD